jgi:hypothetical protein
MMDDIVGNKYGKLTVTEFVESRVYGKQKRRFYKAVCECGGEIIRARDNFKQGTITSCGCLRWRRGSKNPKWGGHGEISGNYWDHVKRGSLKRRFDFSITIQEAWDIFVKQDRKCALSGLPIMFRTNEKSDTKSTASLDRIDSSKGYIAGNIQWVHKDVNRMKQHFDEKYFVEMCGIVSQYKAGTP